LKEYSLILLFAFLLFEVPLGLETDFAPGLSAKNAVLYVFLIILVVQASVQSTELKISFVALHSVFLLLIVFSGASWAISALGYEKIDYPIKTSFIAWKTGWVDRYIFMLVYLYALNSREQVLRVARVLILIVLFSSFVTIIDYLNFPDLNLIEDRIDGRVNGLIGQPNEYGGFLVFWIPVSLGLYLTSHGLRRIIVGAAVLLSILLLVLTGSRGAMAGAVAGSVLAIAMLRHDLPARQLTRGTLAALVVAVTIALVVSIQFTEIVESRIERTMADDVQKVSAGRVDIWSEALSKMADNPESFIYGKGWNSIRLYMDRSSHNMYLGILFELGAIGVGLYGTLLYLILKVFHSGRRIAEGPARTYLTAVIFAFCGVIVSTVFSELNRPWLLIWAFVGLMLRLAFLEELKESSKLQDIRQQ